MSARSTRSSASSRAAEASVRARMVCPAAHAVRAAREQARRAVRLARRSARRRAGRRRRRRRTRRVVRPGTATASRSSATSGVGAVDGRGAVPRRPVRVVAGRGPRPAPGAPRAVPSWSRPGTPRTGPAGAAPHGVAVDGQQPGPFRVAQRGRRRRRAVAGGPPHGGDAVRSRRRRRPAAASAPARGSRRHRSRKTRSTPAVRCSCGGIGAAPAQLRRGSAWWAARAGRAGSRRPRASAGPRPRRAVRRRRARRAAPGRRRRSARRSRQPSGDGSPGRAKPRPAVAVAGGEHDGDPVRGQPPRGDQHRVRGRLVEPLRVVDDAQHGRVLGGLGQHRQGREPDQERLDRRARPPGRTRPAAPAPAAPGAGRGPSTGRSSRCSAANGSGASDSTPWVRSTRTPATSAAACWDGDQVAAAGRSCRRPAHPARPGRRPAPARAWSTRAASCARSSSRPCSTSRPYLAGNRPSQHREPRLFDRGDCPPHAPPWKMHAALV